MFFLYIKVTSIVTSYIYQTTIHYARLVWDWCFEWDIEKLEKKIHLEAALIVTCPTTFGSKDSLLYFETSSVTHG